MADITNNLDNVLDSIMSDLDLEKNLAETKGVNNLMNKFAPQEMDRLTNVLFIGLRIGLSRIVSEQVQDQQEQLNILSTTVVKELQDSSTDLSVKNLEKKFDVLDFINHVYADLSLK